MKLKDKMVASFLVVAVLMVSMNIVNLHTADEVRENFGRAIKDTTPSLVALGHIKAGLAQMKSIAYGKSLIHAESSGDSKPRHMDLHHDEIETIREGLIRWKVMLKENNLGPNQGLIDRINELEIRFYQGCLKLIELKKNGKSGQPVVGQVKSLNQLEKSLYPLLERAMNLEQKRLELGYRRAQTSGVQAQFTNFITMLLVVLLSLILGWCLSQVIANPIVKLKEAAEKVGQGKLDTQVEVNNGDEIGILAQEFNRMVENLSQITVSKRYVDNVFQSMLDCLLVVDLEGVIQRLNRSGEQLLGYKKCEAVGLPLSRLFPQITREEMATGDQWWKGLAGHREERIVLTHSGEEIPVLFSASVMCDEEGREEGLVCVAQDLRERRRLEKQILEISDFEQRRIGQDLHDGLGQHLGGVACFAKILEQRLSSTQPEDAKNAGEIVKYINQAISQTKKLAHGLYPVELESDGLAPALEDLANTSSELFQIDCRYKGDIETSMDRDPTAIHLYRIAQEAVHNAVRHGQAKTVEISLEVTSRGLCMQIADDGVGLVQPDRSDPGLGIHTMRYRASLLRARLDIYSPAEGGTVVECYLPIHGTKWSENVDDGKRFKSQEEKEEKEQEKAGVSGR